MTHIIQLAILLISIPLCASIRCYECADSPRPDDCGPVTECSDDMACYLDVKVATSGRISVETGCKPKQQCYPGSTRRDSDDVGTMSRRADDLVMCSDCCTTDFCNNRGCGHNATQRKNRGPYCYSCGNQDQPDACRTSIQCSQDQMCLLKNMTNTHEFASGCMSKQQCSALDGLDTHSDASDGQPGGATFTKPLCCDNDFCNYYRIHQTVSKDGGWSMWTTWGSCSQTCGFDAKQYRSRACTNPAPQGNGAICNGTPSEWRNCTVTACPVSNSGGWSMWSNWGSCTHTCGPQATQSMSRSCMYLSPLPNATTCIGDAVLSRSCNLTQCPGQWGEWTPWTQCTATCGSSGSQLRGRFCNTGNTCNGDDAQIRHCSASPCPVDGIWGTWTQWTACPAGCDNIGQRFRSRKCDDPPPQFNGMDCSGDKIQMVQCNFSCQVDGQWSAWSTWTPCAQASTKYRSRTCTNPSPKNGGNICKGEAFQMESCGASLTQDTSIWSAWSGWVCGVSCGSGLQTRFRHCEHGKCMGDNQESTSCQARDCPILVG